MGVGAFKNPQLAPGRLESLLLLWGEAVPGETGKIGKIEGGICFPALVVDSRCKRSWASELGLSCLSPSPTIDRECLVLPTGDVEMIVQELVSRNNGKCVIFGFEAMHSWHKSQTF